MTVSLDKIVPVVEPVVETLSISSLAADIRAIGVTDNKSLLETAFSIGLISISVWGGEIRFFDKSFGVKARKDHLRNFAPGYTIEAFVEVGLAYHAHKEWKSYPNNLSYAVLGMSVLTGREPGMTKGVYTKIGPSFGKHMDQPWAQWFYANETCKASTIKVVVEEVLTPEEVLTDAEVIDIVEFIGPTMPVNAKRTRKAKKQIAA